MRPIRWSHGSPQQALIASPVPIRRAIAAVAEPLGLNAMNAKSSFAAKMFAPAKMFALAKTRVAVPMVF